MIKLVFQRKRWMRSINGQLDRHLRGKVQLDTLLSPYPKMTPAIPNISKKNYIQYLVITYNGKEYEKEYNIYMYN